MGDVLVPVVGAVLDEREEPYECVDEGINEHQAELAMDSSALAVHLALCRCFDGRVAG